MGASSVCWKTAIFSVCYAGVLCIVAYFASPNLESTGARIGFFVALCTRCLVVPCIVLQCNFPQVNPVQNDECSAGGANTILFMVAETTTAAHSGDHSSERRHTMSTVSLCMPEEPPSYIDPPGYDEIQL